MEEPPVIAVDETTQTFEKEQEKTLAIAANMRSKEDMKEDDQGNAGLVDNTTLMKAEEQVPEKFIQSLPRWKNKRKLTQHESNGGHLGPQSPLMESNIPEHLHHCYAFVRKLSEAYKHDTNIVSNFSKTVLLYHQRRICQKTPATNFTKLVLKVKNLLKDRPDLFLEFMTCICPQTKEAEEISINEANMSGSVSFVKKIKAADNTLYQRFTNQLERFNLNNSNYVEDIYNQLANLIKDDSDLMKAFVWFFPLDPSKHVTPQALKKSHEAAITNGRQSPRELVAANNSLEEVHFQDPQHNRLLYNPQMRSPKKLEMQVDGAKSGNLQSMSVQKVTEASEIAIIERKAKRTKALDVLVSTHDQDKIPVVSIITLLDRYKNFVRLVDRSLSDNEKLIEFCKCVAMHSEGIITSDKMHKKITELFSSSSKLIDKFVDLVRQCESAETYFLLLGTRALSSDKGVKQPFSEQIENNETKGNVEHSKKWATQSYSTVQATGELPDDANERIYENEYCSSMDVDGDKRDQEVLKGNPWGSIYFSHKKMKANGSDPLEEFFHNNVSGNNLLKEGRKKNEMYSEHPQRKSWCALSTNKYLDTPLSKLDFSKCELSTPSYHLIPDDYPFLKSGSQSTEGHGILNDKWISSTSGKEYSYEWMDKSRSEEVMFRVEEDRFELDMLLEYVNSTIEGLETLLKAVQDNGEVNVVSENYISVHHQRLIELIYLDFGPDIMKCLYQSPEQTVPIVLSRVQQKHSQWLMYKNEINKVWATIIAKNHEMNLASDKKE